MEKKMETIMLFRCKVISATPITYSCNPNWGVPKIRDPFLGVPIIRIIVNWGPPILGDY